VRHALARLRALAQRAEFARIELLASSLERALFVDPFRDARATTPHPPIRTVDHLVTLYAGALSGRS
jgi:hypothetical protein